MYYTNVFVFLFFFRFFFLCVLVVRFVSFCFVFYLVTFCFFSPSRLYSYIREVSKKCTLGSLVDEAYSVAVLLVLFLYWYLGCTTVGSPVTENARNAWVFKYFIVGIVCLLHTRVMHI